MASRSLTAAAYLLVCVVFGGASAAGVLANAAVQITAIALAGALLARRSLPEALSGLRTILSIFALFAALVLLQRVPLPPTLWSALAGHHDIAEAFARAGVAPPWAPLSLAPDATLATLAALAPPLAMLLATLFASPAGRRWAVATLVFAALASLCMGALQRLGGADSPFYLYAVTNRGSAVGFFANRNHLATLLLCALPFVITPGWRPTGVRAAPPLATAVMTAAVALLLIGGVAMAGSRAGWLMLPFVLLGAVAGREWRTRDGVKRVIRAPRWIALIALALVVGAALIATRLNVVVDADVQHRPVLTATTLAAARDHLPFGAGAGSFTRVYPHYEDREAASLEYANHAHDDYAEVLLEGGIPGALLALAAIVWWLVQARRTWGASGEAAALGRAAIVALGVVVFHSAVDYPVRTAAIAGIAGLCAGLALMPETMRTITDRRPGGGGLFRTLIPVPRR